MSKKKKRAIAVIEAAIARCEECICRDLAECRRLTKRISKENNRLRELKKKRKGC
jgi:hypothetical protein